MIKWERAHGAWEKEQLLLPLKEFQAPKHLCGPSAHQSHSRIMKKAIRLNLTPGIWIKKKKNPVISKHPNCMEFGAIWGYYQRCIKRNILGTPLAVQWLGLCNSTAGSVGLIPGRATMMPHAMQWHSFKKEGEKKKEKRERNILVWLKFLIKAQLLNIDNKWPCHYCFQISMEHSGL